MKLLPLNKETINWKDLPVFLFFVVLAFCFWTMQYFQQKMERDLAVPIHYSHVPASVVLHDSLPDTLTLRVSDKGSVFLRHFFGKKPPPLVINLASLPLNQPVYTIDQSNLYAQIQDMLPNTMQILSFKPEKITVNYSPLKQKEVPVHIAGTITPAAGYVFVEGLHIEPNHVRVYGDKQALDTIAWINTVAVTKENIKKKLDLTLQLSHPKGIHLSAQKVKITAEAKEYTEKKFELPVVCRNVPDYLYVRFFPSTAEVVCHLEIDKYTQLNAAGLEVGIDYTEISQHPGTTVLLTLTRKPQWLIDYRIVPETVEYLIEQKRDL